MTEAEKKYWLERVWFKRSVNNTHQEVSKSPYILLVDGPLTFGHSQLVIPANVSTKEDALFIEAQPLIGIVLTVFKEMFGCKQLHTKEAFKKLAKDTDSLGKYIKTLILRTSANENPDNEIKIHLVPYFESHKTKCLERFRLIHGVDEPGGLIGWLGERETEVDKWVLGFPGREGLEKIGRDIWMLPELARLLEYADLKTKDLSDT